VKIDNYATKLRRVYSTPSTNSAFTLPSASFHSLGTVEAVGQEIRDGWSKLAADDFIKVPGVRSSSVYIAPVRRCRVAASCQRIRQWPGQPGSAPRCNYIVAPHKSRPDGLADPDQAWVPGRSLSLAVAHEAYGIGSPPRYR